MHKIRDGLTRSLKNGSHVSSYVNIYPLYWLVCTITQGDSYTDGKVDRNDVTMTLNTTGKFKKNFKQIL